MCARDANDQIATRTADVPVLDGGGTRREAKVVRQTVMVQVDLVHVSRSVWSCESECVDSEAC